MSAHVSRQRYSFTTLAKDRKKKRMLNMLQGFADYTPKIGMANRHLSSTWYSLPRHIPRQPFQHLLMPAQLLNNLYRTWRLNPRIIRLL